MKLNCCEECFPSDYLKDMIRYGDVIGNCSFCSSKHTYVYNPLELSLIFKNLLDLYIISDDGDSIENKLDIDFPDEIFSSKVNSNKKELLKKILSQDLEDYNAKLTNKVILDESLVTDNTLVNTWEGFINEIKEVNRFHIQNTLNEENLKKFFSRLVSDKQIGEFFFRARKSDIGGYPIEKMGKPPKNKSIHGRANPKGISYLYLANNSDTTFYEVRATLLDNVTIGKFKLNENITLIDLRENSYNDIIQLADSEDLGDFLKIKAFIKRLDSELSEPYNHDDKELDYLPTQYISEFIKSLGYKGIIYNSSLSPKGYNLVIFDGSELECIERKVFNIEGIEFNPKEIIV
ncbi:MAG: RES family NAD+ phosphorylase [Candidatus Gracilibacteria bacterium]